MKLSFKKKKNLFELLKTKIIPYRAAIGGQGLKVATGKTSLYLSVSRCSRDLNRYLNAQSPSPSFSLPNAEDNIVA